MKRTLITLLLACLTFSVFAQEWTSINGSVPSTIKTELISSTESRIQVHVQVPGYYATTVATPRGEAYVISLPKAVSTAHAGEPDMPMTGIPVMIGDKARMDVRVIDAQYTDYEGIEVAPSKGDFPRTIDPATVPYTYGDCYSQDAFFPANNVGLYEPYIIRDFRGQNMAVYPFAYNPVTKTLRVYYDMTVEMYKVDDNGTNTMETRRSNVVKMDPDFKSVYQRHFINYEEGATKYTVLDEEGDLLIICYDNFISSMTDFVNWKKTRGINTTIVGTSTAGSSYTAIQTYIRNQYNANNNLTHVLLVGDVAQIPGYTFTDGGSSWSGKGDNQYGQIVGNDIYNDVIIGRFSAGNASQVTTQVNRILTYERDLTTSATWCQNGLGISASAGSGGHYNEDDYEHVENLRTDLLNYGYNTVYQDYAGNLSGYPSSSTTTISNHINSGVGIINYCNHGEQTGWQSHYYMNSNVNALTNNNKLPFIFSVACLVGQYDYSSGDCFAETWMHATNGSTPTGAISGMFSYISQPWIPPMWAQDEFVDILVESYSNNIKHSFGGAAINSLFSIFDHYSTTETSAIGTYKAWVLYGDPTLMMRTKTPQAMTVTHNGSIQPAVTNYTVNVTNGNGALATITNANHEILGKATVSNNTATINITGTLTPGEELTLCVFGYNKVTYLGTIQVIASEGPYITLDSYTPNMALIGQSTNLSLTFKNVGNAATSGNTTVTLTGDSNVTIGTGTKTFSSLAVNANTTVSGFSFTIKPTVTVGSNVTLHYTAVNGSNTWEGDLTVTANQVYTVSVASNNTNYGTVSGGGQYNYNQSCTVTATPADGYMFTNWTSNGSVVSTDASYTFNVTANVDLVANFAAGVMIGSGTGTNDYLPSYNYYNYALTEQIYTSAELGGAGSITSIAFYNGGAAKTRTCDFYLKTTTKSSFSSKTDWITVSSSDKVFSGSVTMAANAWTTITFSTPFEYDGSSNLVLVCDDNTGSYTSSPHMSCRVFTASNQAIYTYDDNTNFNPSSPSASSYNALLSVKNQLIVTKEPISTEPVSITVSANPTNGGSVTGAGTYDIGSSVTLTATANTGYTFTNWTKNGVVVSTSATYSFNASATNSGAYVANFTLNSYTVSIAPNPIEGGTVAFASKEGGEELTYDFEDGWQGWTTFQGNTTSPNSWMHNTAYPTSNNDFTTGYGYNNSDGFMLSESYISGTSSGAGQAVTPDNYLVSPQVRLGGSISFYAGARNTSYCAEKFSVMVSTTDNTNAASFTTVGTWTLSLSEAGYNSTPYTVDLSAYSGMGYIAIRHFDCYDQWFLAVDNITIVEGTIDDGSASSTFNYGTSCTVTATPNANYHFVNWTENGTAVSTEASYTFTVTSGRDLVANFSAQQPSLVGDVNEDGVISIDDVSVLLSHVLGNISLTGQVLINADVNGDGVISIDDVSTLLYMSMNK